MTAWPANSHRVDVDVHCHRCGDPYGKHEPGGGACRARDGGRCPCLGFQWVNPKPDGVTYGANGPIDSTRPWTK